MRSVSMVLQHWNCYADSVAKCNPPYRSVMFCTMTCSQAFSLLRCSVDIVVQCPSVLDHNLSHDSRLILEVLFAEDRITRIGPLVRDFGVSWQIDRNIEV